MRLSLLILACAAGLAAAGAAKAQMMPMMSSQPPQATYGGDQLGFPRMTPQQRYVEQLARLRKRLLQLTRDDGGQLSEAHRQGLQQELDAVNREYSANLKVMSGRPTAH